MMALHKQEQLSSKGSMAAFFRAFPVMWRWDRRTLLTYTGFSFLLSLLGPLNTVATKMTLDSISSLLQATAKMEQVIFSVCLLIVLMIGTPIVGSILHYLEVKLKQAATRGSDKEIGNQMATIKFEHFEDENVLNLFDRYVKDAGVHISTHLIEVVTTLRNVVSLIGFGLIIVGIRWWYLFITILIIFPMLWLQQRNTNRVFEHNMKKAVDYRYTDYLSGVLLNRETVKEIRFFGAAGFLQNMWRIKLLSNMRAFMQIKKNMTKAMCVLMALHAATGFIGMCFLVAPIVQGAISLSDYVALNDAGGSITMLLAYGLSGSFGRILEATKFWTSYESFMAFQHMKEDALVKTDTQDFSIIFDHVSFRYPNTDADVLRDVSFTIKHNEKVVLVGENGSGKSTIIKLILGLYEPTQGCVRVCGRDVTTIPQKQRAQLFSPVFQDYVKYWLTFRESIAMGNMKDLNNGDALRCAAEKGGIWDAIEKQPQQLDTQLGKVFDSGLDLSEGQWQKLSIARAFASDSRGMVFDEPTAALDPMAESELYNHFMNLCKNKASVMVSHRLSSSKIAHKILVLHGGQMLEQGTHEELIAQGELYEKMFVLQAKGYMEDVT